MEEYREALQRLVDPVESILQSASSVPAPYIGNPMDPVNSLMLVSGRKLDAVRPEIDAAKALLARGEPTYTAPIARLTIDGGLVVRTGLYAPGLPDGEHDVFPSPPAATGEPK